MFDSDENNSYMLSSHLNEDNSPWQGYEHEPRHTYQEQRPIQELYYEIGLLRQQLK